MSEIIMNYPWSVWVLGLTAALSLVQLLTFDVMAIKLKHPPGFPIESSHDNLLFRLSRAHANTNETMGVLILLFLFAVFSAADPNWVNGLMVGYLVARVLHMLCYYLAWSAARGVVFGISILCLVGLFVIGVQANLA